MGTPIKNLIPPGSSGSSGGIGSIIGQGVLAGAQQATMAAQLDHLTKLVHILWKEVERLESIVQVIPEGLRIKSGMSEILVLKNGGIIINGIRVLLQTPGKQQLML